jgi:hypothetical protein
MSGTVAVLYGLHLTVIAGINALLWLLAVGPGLHPELAGATFPLLVFIPGTLLAAIEPRYAIWCWVSAFGGFLVQRLLNRSDDEDAVTSPAAPSPEDRSRSA